MADKLVAIDIAKPTGAYDAEAYYRMPDEMLEFIKIYTKDHEVLGFVFDGTTNFGVLLKKKPEGAAPNKRVRVRGPNPL